MKEKYIELMEKVLSAYTDEHIQRYYNEVKENGLTEHGFPRLTANIGILNAHGKRKDLLPLFIEMMDLCCDMFLRPYVRSANEFSIREIIGCIWALEAAPDTVPDEYIARWKNKLAAIDPAACYDSYEQSLNGQTRNWAVFMAVSELFREKARLRSGVSDFIDTHMAHQLKWFDENGMYEDNKHATGCYQPIMYDYVTRGLFAMLLHFGYRGKHYHTIDACLKKAGLLTLKMQSSSGEIPFGGRSNQFLHNEAWMMFLFEYEAARYAKEGNTVLAAAFKSAVGRTFAVTESWLANQPIRHIKNRFPTDTKYGCEQYAYFDKYMITAASNLYAAYLLCDDSIPTAVTSDHASAAFQTSGYFHKLFLKSGGYALEFDTNADPQYDASGLGRVHREGAPSTICLSCPCPSKPKYTVDIENPFAFSMCSAIRENDSWMFGAAESAKYEVSEYSTHEEHASATILCQFPGIQTVREHYTVNESGVSITVEGDGEIGYTLPAFCFDGEVSPKITLDNHVLTVSYDGWVCKYAASGRISDLNLIAANRNGHYRVFLASAQNALTIKIEITKE